MSEENYEKLADLNEVALNELKVLVSQNTDLTSEWKQVVSQLLESDNIPQNLESIEQLIAGK